MGIIQNSKQIALSGRMGPTVYYTTKKGKQVFRAYVKPADPKTPKQMAQRARLSLANHGLAPLRDSIRQGYPHDDKAYYKLVGKACREAITGTYPDFTLDYSKIDIASGPLSLPGNLRLSAGEGFRSVTLRWDVQKGSALQTGNDNDKVYVVCLNTDFPEQRFTHARAIRADGQATVPLPEGWRPDSTHFWVYLASRDRKKNSGSVHLSGGESPS